MLFLQGSVECIWIWMFSQFYVHGRLTAHFYTVPLGATCRQVPLTITFCKIWTYDIFCVASLPLLWIKTTDADVATTLWWCWAGVHIWALPGCTSISCLISTGSVTPGKIRAENVIFLMVGEQASQWNRWFGSRACRFRMELANHRNLPLHTPSLAKPQSTLRV